jgi:hypothetical protein
MYPPVFLICNKCGFASAINPALASKMTGEALLTRDSDTFQFFSQFFGGVLEWRDVVPQQQVGKFRAFAGRDAAFSIPLHHRSFIHFTAKARLVATEFPHGVFGNFDCDWFRHDCNLSESGEAVKSAFLNVHRPEPLPAPAGQDDGAQTDTRTVRSSAFTRLLWDAQTYRAAALGQLYFRRWAVELFFRDIKTTLGLDVLRTQTPAMVRKEIVMHAIAYNLIRALRQDIAHSYQVPLRRLSFKGPLDTFRQWRELFENAQTQPRTTCKLRRLFHQSIAHDLRLDHPDRSEPRAVKRRPKNFRLLTKPRHEMIVERNRKCRQKPSKHALN